MIEKTLVIRELSADEIATEAKRIRDYTKNLKDASVKPREKSNWSKFKEILIKKQVIPDSFDRESKWD